MRDAARFRRARHRKQINPKTCAYQCPTTFCLTVDPPPSLRRFASRASAASARLSTASSPSTPASVATVPPWRCVRAPRGRREAPHFSPLRVAHDWGEPKSGYPPSATHRSPFRTLRSPPSLSFSFLHQQELGWYDPIKKQSNLNAPAIKAWLAKGAQPSETVGALLRKSLIIEK
jgi:hypothetical protein